MASSGMKRYGSSGFDPYMYTQRPNNAMANGIASGVDNYKQAKAAKAKRADKKIKARQKNSPQGRPR
jgi:hypothetical protein